MFAATTDDAVVETMGQLHGVSAASHRLFLAGVLEVDQRSLWRTDGAHSMEMWLDMRFGMAHTTARATVRVARAFVFAPEIAAQYDAGHLSWDQVVACVDLVAFGAFSDAELAQDAVGRSAAELERLAREARRVSREEANERHRRRYFRNRWDRDMAGARFNGWLPDAEAKVVETALRRLADAAPENPDRVPLFRPFEERMADALVNLASARLAADADPDLATVVVHVDASDLDLDGHGEGDGDGADDVDSGTAVIDTGPVVSMATFHRLACDGRIQYLFDDPFGETVHAAKVKHGIPPWLRRKIRHRDKGCRFPGCGRTALLHIHHVRWWTRGGLTEECNLCALCSFHHRLVHEGAWTIHGQPSGRLRFVSPEGRVLEGGPPGLHRNVRDQFDFLRTATDADPPPHAPAA